MSESAREPSSITPLGVVGFLLTRLVVPAWIVSGAMVKMLEASPKLLPRNAIIAPAGDLGIDLRWLLAVLVIIELIFAVGILLFGRLARFLAASMLIVFCAVLIYELANGASSCGCLGSKSPPPLTMLIIDGIMLAGVVFIRPAAIQLGPLAIRLGLALVTSVAAIAATWHFVDPNRPVTIIEPESPDEPIVELPDVWFLEDASAWIGRPWTEFDLVTYMGVRRPEVPATGTHHLFFYSRTCEHCFEHFQTLALDPALARRTIAFEIPVAPDRIRDEADAWEMIETEAQLTALPLGPDYVITSPIAVRIKDGVIQCLAEGKDADACLTSTVDADASAPAEAASGDAGGDAAPADDPVTEAPAPTPPPAPVVTGPRPNPNPQAPADSWWFTDDLDQWIGRSWTEFDLFRFMRTWPSVPAEGVRYVVFYGRTCEHCVDMFEDDLSNPALGAMTTAVEVPIAIDQMRDERAAWPMPNTEVELLELPLGIDWIITTPLAVRIENGVITCIEEGDHATCFDLGG